ncbi:MAG: hypothetical protein ABIH53_04965, partial [archaeon]
MRVKRYFDVLSYYASFFSFRPMLLMRKGLNFLDYSVYPRKTYCSNLPISAQLEPTLRCNLKCTMCV